MSLTEKINACLELVRAHGLNDDFALFHYGDSEWSAEVVNEVPAVSLGESVGRFSADGNSPESAVDGLFACLRVESP